MKFNVGKETLSYACSVVSKALSVNTTQPILSCIYMRAESGTLEVQATNLTTYIKTTIPIHVEEAGEALVSGKILLDIMKVLPDAVISVTSSGKETLLECGRSSYKLNTLNVSDYQEFLFQGYDMENMVELPQSVAKRMVDKVYKVVSRDDSRPVLKGIFLTVNNNVVRMVASDSLRVAVCDTHIETSNLTQSFALIVPGSAFYDFLSLTAEETNILVGQAKGQVVLKSSTTTYLTRGIEGVFVDYTNLLPTEYFISAETNTEDFIGSVKRISPISRAAGSIRGVPLVYFALDPDGGCITISSGNTDQGCATETIDATISGQQMDIRFNAHSFLECLSSVDEKTMFFELGNLRGKPVGLIKSNGSVNYLCLILPNVQR